MIDRTGGFIERTSKYLKQNSKGGKMRHKNDSTKRFLEELSTVNESVPIIVEGSRDVQTLRALGIRGRIVTVHSGRSIQSFCDEYSETYGEAVILTDWDSRGNQIFVKITRFLEADWERHNHFRSRLMELAGGTFREVEKMMVWEHLALSHPA
jgi:5S rRNA maturation endonuclease (ribonuclease M5)